MSGPAVRGTVMVETGCGFELGSANEGKALVSVGVTGIVEAGGLVSPAGTEDQLLTGDLVGTDVTDGFGLTMADLDSAELHAVLAVGRERITNLLRGQGVPEVVIGIQMISEHRAIGFVGLESLHVTDINAKAAVNRQPDYHWAGTPFIGRAVSSVDLKQPVSFIPLPRAYPGVLVASTWAPLCSFVLVGCSGQWVVLIYFATPATLYHCGQQPLETSEFCVWEAKLLRACI